MKIFQFKNLQEQKEIIHFVSTRQGGVSKGAYKSLNIAFDVGDEKENVLQNRRLIMKEIGVLRESLVMAKQTHGSNVAVVREEDRGKGAFDFESALDGVDGMITNVPNVCLVVKTADCVPILLFDPARKVIGAVHAGWKGTVSKIAQEGVEKMVEVFGSDPKNILAGIGPSIGPCCYEVGSDVSQNVKIAFPDVQDQLLIQRENSVYFDLWMAGRIQLEKCGVTPKNIETMDVCTSCRSDLFYSVRKDGTTGRFWTGICLM